MKNAELKKLFQPLKDLDIKVDSNWQKSNKEKLLAFIAEDRRRLLSQEVEIKLGLFERLRQLTEPLTRPASLALAVILSFAAGITGVVQASEKSLPGESLYPVKRSWEHVKYNLAIRDDSKAQLELASAQTRVDELGQLFIQSPTVDPQAIEQAVTDFHKNISAVKYHLESAKADNQGQGASDIAKNIDSHAQAYSDALEQVKIDIDKVDDEKLKSEIGKKVNLALTNLEDADLSAISLIIDKLPTDNGPSAREQKQQVKNILTTKLGDAVAREGDNTAQIESTEKDILKALNADTATDRKQIIEKINKVEETISQIQDLNQKAKDSLKDGNLLLIEGDFSGFMQNLILEKAISQDISDRLDRLTNDSQLNPAAPDNGDQPANNGVDNSDKAGDVNTNQPVNNNSNAPVTKTPDSNTNTNEPTDTNVNTPATNSPAPAKPATTNVNSNSNINAPVNS